MPFNGVIFTAVLAGLAATSIVSPGLKGLGTPFLAFLAGFLTDLIFIRPGIVNSPAAPFLRWRSMRPDSSSRTAVTCFLLRSVLSESEETIALFVYFSLIAGGLFAAMDLSFSCSIATLGPVGGEIWTLRSRSRDASEKIFCKVFFSKQPGRSYPRVVTNNGFSFRPGMESSTGFKI